MALDKFNNATCDHTGADLTTVPVRIAAAVEHVPPRPGTQPPTLHFDSWASLRDYAAARASEALYSAPALPPPPVEEPADEAEGATDAVDVAQESP